MPQAEPSTPEGAVPAAGRPLAPGALSVGRPARGGCCTTRARPPGRRRERDRRGGGQGARGLPPRRAGGRALTSTHRAQGEPEQQERLHAEPKIHAAPPAAAAQPWPGGGGGEAGSPEAERGASRGLCVRARNSRGSRAARPCAPSRAAGRWPAASSSLPQPPSAPRGSAAQLAAAAPGAAASSFQVADCSAATPTARGSGCQRECAPLTPGAAFCSLWLGREPTWSCGHREGWRGARKRERERASRTAPLPAARTRQPQPGREREPRGGPTTKAARPLRQPTTAPRDNARLARGQRVWRPEGFQTQEAFGAVEGHI